MTTAFRQYVDSLTGTRADKFRAFLLHLVGHAYTWGDIPGDADGDPWDGDCSGVGIAAWKVAGVTFPGRPTAEVFRKMGERIPNPNRVGDYAVLLRADGTAHHVIWHIGHGEWVEAKSRFLNPHGIVRTTTDAVEERGGRFYRLRTRYNAALGSLSVPSSLVCTKTHGARPRPSSLSVPRLDCKFMAGSVYREADGHENGFVKMWIRTKSGTTVQAWGYSHLFR